MISTILMIRYGSLFLHYGENIDRNIFDLKKQLGIYGESSVIFVETDDEINILIDSGFKNEIDNEESNRNANRKEMMKLLEQNNLHPDDIHEIFITHWHLDHFGNLPMFENATVFYAGESQSYIKRVAERYNFSTKCLELKEGDIWHDGISVIHTPGHNMTHHSVVIEYEGTKLIAAGDAIVSKDYYDFDAVYPFNSDFMSAEIALQSMEKIKQIADVILPGHDQPFQNWKGLK